MEKFKEGKKEERNKKRNTEKGVATVINVLYHCQHSVISHT